MTKTDVVIEQLSYRNPVLVNDLASSSHSQDQLELLRCILASSRGVPLSSTPARALYRGLRPLGLRTSSRPPYKRLLVATGTSVVVAATVIPTLVLVGSSVAPATAAAAVLRKEAVVAAHQPDAPRLASGGYFYTKSMGVLLSTDDYGNPSRTSTTPVPSTTTTTGSHPLGTAPSITPESIPTKTTGPTRSFSVLVPFTRQVWEAADGAGRIHETYGTPTFPSAADRRAWLADGSPTAGPPPGGIDIRPGSGKMGIANLAALPTDPANLGAEIKQRKVVDGPRGNGESFKIIGELLAQAGATPMLRSALYEVAAALPGVNLVGPTRDPLGRSGVAVAFTENGQNHELIFDPQTSTLLASEDFVTGPTSLDLDVASGTLIGSTTYVATGQINSTSAIPAPVSTRKGTT
ncbi:MAG: CU044_5270 family protein [Acidimicrobiales bacterium]